MKTKILTALSVIVLMGSCGLKKENQSLQAEIDSLNIVLEFHERMVAVLEDVGVLMDSIDASRGELEVHMEMGLTYDDYNARLLEINEYVKNSTRRLEDLEKNLAKANSTNKTYAATIARLRKELAEKTEQVALLEQTVDEYKTRNKELILLTELQSAEINDKTAQIAAKYQELEMLETRITALLLQSKVSEADAYFLRAQAAEVAAQRTQLAPKRKKASYREALDLYQKAFDLGRDDAKPKIEALAKKVG